MIQLKSIINCFHQRGASAQQVVEQALAKNKNGVPMQ